MSTLLLSVVVLGICFALIALRMLVVKDRTFRGTCGRSGDSESNDCSLCPGVESCPDAKEGSQEPKSSNAMFSRGTPRSSSIRKQACSINGGPQI
jgi:hypothetical protein